MSMSTHIKGFRSADNPEYKKHAAVLKACADANIEWLPKETAKYFGTNRPDLCYLEESLEVDIPKVEWSDGDMRGGFEILVNQIPGGVEKIRFYNSF